MGKYHELERAVNAGWQETRRPRSGDFTLKEVGELYGAPYRRPSPPWLGHWQRAPPDGGVGFSPPTRRGARRRTTGMYALARCDPLAPTCCGRAPIFRGGPGRIPGSACPPTPLSSRPELDHSTCTTLRPTPPPSLLVVDIFPLRSRPPPPRKLLTTNILSTVPVDGHLPHNSRTAFPPVVAEGACHANLRRCLPLSSRLRSATNLPFRLGKWSSWRDGAQLR